MLIFWYSWPTERTKWTSKVNHADLLHCVEHPHIFTMLYNENIWWQQFLFNLYRCCNGVQCSHCVQCINGVQKLTQSDSVDWTQLWSKRTQVPHSHYLMSFWGAKSCFTKGGIWSIWTLKDVFFWGEIGFISIYHQKLWKPKMFLRS